MLSSRMFGKDDLINKTPDLYKMLKTTFSKHDNGTLTSKNTGFLSNLVAGGKVLESKPYVSVNPQWRKTYVLNEIITETDYDLDPLEVKAFKDNFTFRKTQAMKDITPGMGAYLNEADGNDPQWKEDFFGSSEHYNWLKSIKQKYDPNDVFWCWRCVGSEGWVQESGSQQLGPLCRAR